MSFGILCLSCRGNELEVMQAVRQPTLQLLSSLGLCVAKQSVLPNILILFVIVEWLVSIAELAIFVWGGLHNLGYYNLWLLYNHVNRAASITHTEMILPYIVHTTYVYQLIFGAGCVLLSWSGMCRSSVVLPLPSLKLPAIVTVSICHVPLRCLKIRYVFCLQGFRKQEVEQC